MTLRELRQTHGYTQTDVARLIGVSHVTIINWEFGRSLPTKRHTNKLGRLYGLDDSAIYHSALEARANAVKEFGL